MWPLQSSFLILSLGTFFVRLHIFCSLENVLFHLDSFCSCRCLHAKNKKKKKKNSNNNKASFRTFEHSSWSKFVKGSTEYLNNQNVKIFSLQFVWTKEIFNKDC